MKPAVLLALPALALAAATPAKIEKRQLPELPLDPTCVLGITGITRCVPSLGGLDPTNPPTTLLLSQLIGLGTCGIGIILDVLDCLI
ncbi:hypothetical protein Neosp_013169 [[Neocosmospora] mangrovei]